jgi:hypothetical protein
MPDDENRIYQALALPAEALEQGGAEILRAGLINDELYVGAARAFDDPAIWGDVLGDIARSIAEMMAAEDGAPSQKDILTGIVVAFLADVGAPVARDRVVKPKKATKKAAKKIAKKKPAAKSKKKPAAKKSAAKKSKRSKR